MKEATQEYRSKYEEGPYGSDCRSAGLEGWRSFIDNRSADLPRVQLCQKEICKMKSGLLPFVDSRVCTLCLHVTSVHPCTHPTLLLFFPQAIWDEARKIPHPFEKCSNILLLAQRFLAEGIGSQCTPHLSIPECPSGVSVCPDDVLLVP